MTLALIAGSFLPPHAGHQLLGGAARGLAERLAIALLVGDDDPIPAGLRERWLAEMLPHAQLVRCRRETAAAEIGRALGRVDLLVSADDAPAALADALGARLVAIDPGREAVPVSGRAILADPAAHWRFVPAAVRPHLVRTICLHGPESTGKSVLAPKLVARMGTIVVPEYGRTWCEANGTDLAMVDLVEIARTHAGMIAAAKRIGGPALILDTDPLMTAAWAEMLFDEEDAWFGRAPVADLYLLLDIDVPWVDDGTRMFGSEAARRRFMDVSRAQLERRALPYAVIGGPLEGREALAIEAIERHAFGSGARPERRDWLGEEQKGVAL